MKNVLLLAHDDAGQEARFQTALDLTRALGGHLRCVDVAILPVVVDEMWGASGAGAILMADEVSTERVNRVRITARLEVEDVAWDWIDVTGDLADSVLAEAQLADVIVINRKLDGTSQHDMAGIAKRIVMHARRLVVAVPDSIRRFATERALIAWDGSDAAATAMRAAVPLLQLAEAVELFAVRGRAGAADEQTDTVQPAEYLSRHGIHALVREQLAEEKHPFVRIEEEALNFDADYLVMGAFGHGIVHAALGGVTREMLRSSQIPLLLAH